MSPPILVIGAGGQDGSLLCEEALRRGIRVVGVNRRGPHSAVALHGNYQHISVDIADRSAFAEVLLQTRPSHIFHLAAIHGSSGFAYEPVWHTALNVNVGSLHQILEHCRITAPETGIVYASSCKVFGDPLPALMNEDTPRRSDCLYSVTKNAADALVANYRARHGLKAFSLILFNHESARRAPSFFIPRLAAALRAARRGVGDKVHFHTLDFHCDWGLATDYMTIALDLALAGNQQDLVLATGHTHFARTLVAEFFARHGLDWHDHLVEVAGTVGQPYFQADTSRLLALHQGAQPEGVHMLLDQLATQGPEYV